MRCFTLVHVTGKGCPYHSRPWTVIVFDVEPRVVLRIVRRVDFNGELALDLNLHHTPSTSVLNIALPHHHADSASRAHTTKCRNLAPLLYSEPQCHQGVARVLCWGEVQALIHKLLYRLTEVPVSVTR
jgi:hypothetical protein